MHLSSRCTRRYENHINRCHPCSAAISPCGRFIATGSEDNCVSNMIFSNQRSHTHFSRYIAVMPVPGMPLWFHVGVFFVLFYFTACLTLNWNIFSNTFTLIKDEEYIHLTPPFHAQSNVFPYKSYLNIDIEESLYN